MSFFFNQLLCYSPSPNVYFIENNCSNYFDWHIQGKIASHRFVVDKWSSILVACCSSSVVCRASTNSTVPCHTVMHRVIFIVSLFVSVPFCINFCSVRNWPPALVSVLPLSYSPVISNILKESSLGEWFIILTWNRSLFHRPAVLAYFIVAFIFIKLTIYQNL